MGRIDDGRMDILALYIIVSALIGLSSAAVSSSFDDEIDMTDCGKTKGCMAYPKSCLDTSSSDECLYLVTFKENADDSAYIDFELSGQYGDDYLYVSISFSDDDKMGADDIIACYKKSDGNLYIKHSRNHGYENEGFTGDYGITDMKATHVDNVMRCGFSRIIDNTGYEDVEYHDLSKEWVLVLAAGAMDGSTVDEHYEIPRMSLGKVKLTSTDIIDVMGVNNYIMAHGILMMISWLVLVVIAITLSRFYKDIWPDVKVMGLPIWFQGHRFLMCAALLFSVIGLICIVVYWEGWDEEAGSHGIMGVIVVVLGIANPIVALARPAPDAGTSRVVWKIIHSVVGSTPHYMSFTVIAIATGLELIRGPVMGYIGYGLCVGTYLICTLVLVVVRCKMMKCSNKTSAPPDKESEGTLEMDPGTDSRHATGVLIHKVVFVVMVTLLLISVLVAILGDMFPWHNY